MAKTGGAPVPPRELDPGELKYHMTRLKRVPTLPKLQERVVAALEDPEVDFNRVAELIEVDQALSSQILRLANSSFYGTQGSVSQVSRALLILGATVTRSIVLTASVVDMRSVGLKGFFEHSLGCAVAAGALAKVTGAAAPEEVSAAGLLHDIGKMMLFKELPQAFAHVVAISERDGRSFREVERDLLGVDHSEIASWVIERWNFPPCLAEPIVFHHAPSRARLAPNETAIVHVADSVVRALRFGSGGDDRIPAIDPGAAARLDLTPEVLDRALELFDSDLDHALNYALFE
jgi:putative nucleotidyltransferase with HDIG domain